jgi:uracil-DNA glycosylase
MQKLQLPDNDWRQLLQIYTENDTFHSLEKFLIEEYSSHLIYPPASEIFHGFKLTSFSDTRVLILGQDPYHGPNQAHGLAFSVKSPCPPPPSLKNIFKELSFKSNEGDLSSWAKQGVFLLNTVLTVREAQPNSHKQQGWEKFTDHIIHLLSEKKEKMIFVLWGAPAQKKKTLIDSKKHLILEAPHPSPLSAYRGFFGCDHFAKINLSLSQSGQKPIDWTLKTTPQQPELF